MNYFQEYEARRSLYKKVKPGSVWKYKAGTYNIITISSVDYETGRIYGTWKRLGIMGHLGTTIKWLLNNYYLVKD